MLTFKNSTGVTSVEEDLLLDIVSLSTFDNQIQTNYKVVELTNTSITVKNVSDSEDYVDLDIFKVSDDTFEVDFSEFSLVTNIDDFYDDLENAFINQEVSDEKTMKRCSN